jgi:hypothetical protein
MFPSWLPCMLNKSTKPSRRQRRVARPALRKSFRPRLEILEDRTLPSATPISATLPVSVASSGTVMGNGYASVDPPAVSANGQYEVFTSNATDLVNGVTTNPNQSSGPGSGYHLYWRNLSNGTTAAVDVDVNNPNELGNYSARFPSITPDGRYVAFLGFESDLTNNAANASQPQIYVRDVQAGQTYLVSLGTDGKPENGTSNQSQTPSITEDGNGHLLIAYQSNATNLTANDTSSSQQIFLASLNLDSGGDIQYSSLKTTLVSAASSGNGGNGDSLNPLLSKDGSTLSFTSYASNLNVPGGYSDNSGVQNLYLYSLGKQTLSLLSAEPTTSAAATGNSPSTVYLGGGGAPNPYVAPQSVSANGQYVVFSTYADNLVPGLAIDTDSSNVYQRNLANGTTNLVSINAAGTAGVGAFNEAFEPVMTPDGRYIAFYAIDGKGDLTGNDPGGANVFVRDMQQGKTYLVSLGTNGSAANGSSADPTIAETSNGQLVIAYRSVATNLTGNSISNTGGDGQVFVTTFNLDANGDIQYNTLSTKLASATSNGAGDNGDNSDSILSKDGSTLAFLSTASNLPGESGTGTQLFAYNVASGALTQVSPAAGGTVANALGISDNGQYIAYHYTPSSDDEVLAWNANTGTNTVIDNQEIENNPLNIKNTNFGDVQISGDGSTIVYKVGDVFAHNWFEVASNWQSGSPTRTTISDKTQVFTPSSPSISISEDGKVIAYQFEDSLSKYPWVVVYDSGTTSDLGGGSDGAAGTPIVSADGSTVVFNFSGNDLVSGITDFIPGQDNVFAYNVASKTVSLVSAKAPGVFTTDENISLVSLSDNGRYVAYFSSANDLLGNLSSPNIFAEDVQQGVPTVIPSGPGPIYSTVLSGDGSTLAFQSGNQIYSINWLAANPTTTLVSVSSTGGSGNGFRGSSNPSISDNGQVIAFQSDANNLTANDANANGYQQIFVRNLGTNTTTLVSSNSAGTDGGNGDSNSAVISSDGSTVIYNSQATDLVSGLSFSTDSSGNPIVPQLYAFLSNPSAPVITAQPSNQTVTVGQTATFTAAASGSPPPMIQWQVSSDGGKTFSNISGATSTTLTLNAAVAGSSNGNEYRAVFTNSLGSTNTSAATLTVQVPPNFITPNSAVFTVGQDGSFNVTASGYPAPTLTESGALPSGVTFTTSTDYSDGVLTLSGTPAAGTQGTYHFSITAQNAAGSITQSFTLTVNPAPVPPSPPPVLNAPPLLAFFDSLLGGTETVNANGTETITDSVFGIPLLVATFDSSGNLVSVDLFGIDVTFLFLLL